MCSACEQPHKLYIYNRSTVIVTATSPQKQKYDLIYTCPIKDRQQVYRGDLDPLSGKGDPDIMHLEVLSKDYTPKPKNRSHYLGIEEEALAEYAKTSIKESEDLIKKFITFMVPLTTALITTYLALLEFVGVETIENVTASNNQILLPPILMIISLGIFISANFPYIGGIASGNVQSIYKHRSNSLNWKS